MEPRIEPNKGFGVTAIFSRECGHEDKLFYADKRFALADTYQAAQTQCLSCRNRE